MAVTSWNAVPGLVAADRLRFDFSNTQAVSAEELQRVEELVNAQIRENAPAETRVMALDEAKAAGAMSLFGEKYESDVRVLSFGDFTGSSRHVES